MPVTGTDSIFTEKTWCKFFKLSVDGIQIPTDFIIGMEVDYSFFKFGITGFVSLKDKTGELSVNWDATHTYQVKLSFLDYHENEVNLIFESTSVTPKIDGKFQHVTLSLRDVTSTRLLKMNDSYSFSSQTYSEAFKKYISKADNPYELDIEPAGNAESFTVTNSKSGIGGYGAVSRFFFEKFRKNNIRIWIDHKKIHVKKYSLQKAEDYKDPSTNKRCILTNKNVNQYYRYHIHEYYKDTANRSSQMAVQSVQRIENGNIITDSVNLDDIANDLQLNDNVANFKDSVIFDKSSAQTSNVSETKESQEYDLFEHYIQTNKMVVFIPGNADINIGQKIETEIISPSAYNDRLLKGDLTMGGVWMIQQVTDKFVGDSFIQRLVLCRFDNPKEIK